MLKDDGSLYCFTQFIINDDEIIKPNYQLYIDKIYSFGFVFRKFITFSIYESYYLKFTKTVLPTKTECFNYLKEIIETRALLHENFHVKLINLKCYSAIYDMNITYNTIVDNNFDIKNLLPYKNYDEDDQNYIDEDEKYTPEDIIKLKYIMADQTTVTLI